MLMKELIHFFFSFVMLVAFCIAGFLVGAVVADGVLTGDYSGWKLLGSSYEFEQIVEANSYMVLAQAENGNLYAWDSNCLLGIHCRRWIEVSEIPDDMHNEGEMAMQKGDMCEPQVKLPAGIQDNVIECARGWYAGPEFGHVAYYILLDNGKIWAWRHSSSMIMDIVAPFSFRIGGIVLGFGAFIVFMRFRIGKKTSVSPSTSTV